MLDVEVEEDEDCSEAGDGEVDVDCGRVRLGCLW